MRQFQVERSQFTYRLFTFFCSSSTACGSPSFNFELASDMTSHSLSVLVPKLLSSSLESRLIELPIP